MHSSRKSGKPEECIPVGFVPPARYRTMGGGGLPDSDPLGQTPPDRDHPPGQRPSLDRDPPRTESQTGVKHYLAATSLRAVKITVFCY